MSEGLLTRAERDRIAQPHQQGASQAAIALAIGRHPSTISRELRRNATGGEYLAAQAQEQTERRRRERLLTRKLDRPDLEAFVRQASPDAGRPSRSRDTCGASIRTSASGGVVRNRSTTGSERTHFAGIGNRF